MPHRRRVTERIVRAGLFSVAISKRSRRAPLKFLLLARSRSFVFSDWSVTVVAVPVRKYLRCSSSRMLESTLCSKSLDFRLGWNQRKRRTNCFRGRKIIVGSVRALQETYGIPQLSFIPMHTWTMQTSFTCFWFTRHQPASQWGPATFSYFFVEVGGRFHGSNWSFHEFPWKYCCRSIVDGTFHGPTLE